MNRPNHPELRSDLQWTLHHFADGTSYSVLDPHSGSSYQVGQAEYALVSMLDGKTSIAEAAAATSQLAAKTGDENLAIDETEANQIVTWLTSMGLIQTHDTLAMPPTSASPRASRWSAITIKMPLGDPTAIVDGLHAWFRPLASRTFLYLAFACIALALFQVFTQWPRWNAALRPLSDPNAWWTLAMVALLLRVVHESAHAVVARRFDVAVDQIGILWILMVPLPYLDVSRSWQRNRRRERMAIAGAGMLAELVIAAIAVFVFTWTRSPWLQHVAATVAVAASAITLIFNANVLMRFDGYHLLVDAIGFPNLYGDAASYWREWTARMVLGKQQHRFALPGGPLGWFVRLYGIAAALWRVLVIVGLILAAEHILGGLGVLLALAAVLGITVRTLTGVPNWFQGVAPRRAIIGIVVSALIMTVIWMLPMPGQGRTWGVVQYRQPTIVRAPADGFVRHLMVQRGDRVQRGDVLIRIENAELLHQTNMTKIQRHEAELKFRQLLAGEQIASVSAQWSSITQIDQQLQSRQDQIDGMTIRAACDGIVDAPDDLQRWLGRYVHEGTPLLRIVNEVEKEIVLLVDQKDRENWIASKNKTLRIAIPRAPSQTKAIVDYVAPRASITIGDESMYGQRHTLGSHLGGPLSVRAHSADNTYRLLEPRVEVKLHPLDSSPLRDGQRVWVFSSLRPHCVGEVVGGEVVDWLDQRVARHSLLRQWTSF